VIADPQISIVISTHNRAAYLDGCLGSIANQNYPGRFEVVVIDNASQDNTGEVLAGWCGRDLRFRTAREPRLGQSMGKNLGVKMALAPLILFTDDDGRAAGGSAPWRREETRTKSFAW
jgi:glycosyltransferase involved in cell wall biosynthesis